MNSKLQTNLKNLPSSPGVYQFLNKNGKVIYVGKAKNLKNRVRSYFQENPGSAKTIALVSKIEDLQLVVTDSELEALILENNLIKQYKPRYNVNLKDDKSFPFIKITNELFPRIYATRNVVNDGSKYFGPYTDVKSMRTSLKIINQIFKVRSCKLDLTEENIAAKKFRVCLDYHINKCDGPCEGLISPKDYNDMVNEVIKLLKGKTNELIKELSQKMQMYSSNLEFEKAAEIRDKINQLESLSAKQKVVSEDYEDRDVFAIAYEGKDSACAVFNIRDGKLIGKKQLKLSIEDGEEIEEIYSFAIKYYYGELAEIPKEIVLEVKPNDEELLIEWLKSKTDKKVKIIVPQRGDLKSLIKMCKENAILQLKEIQLQKMKNLGNVSYSVSALQRDLRLKTLPRKIECFDISNLQGTDSVASMVVFEDGKPKKSQYRKFIIKTVAGPDDFSSMREVIERRYSRLLEENQPLPDLIMVDGGKGQLSSAVEVMDNLGFKDYNIIGLAKRLEEVFLPGKSDPELIPKTSSGLKLLQQIRDEAHRFAITFHRERRSKRIIKTELTDIKGIGTETAKLLLEKFGSLDGIRNSSIEELENTVGKKKTQLLIEYFKTKIIAIN
ncbi:MAG TPA: excinuclease ABC subunit UvrC [Ignavibacteriaceae bacterium]|nr:MAG: UvrABC system protein C [Ignavibacteria bacterium ADurb.Bin266]OQY75411.1 MAG: excinuclease ABC subunit C [Ignavibacteriales bacterium UTCHB2]HQF41944.1 excinuclease ABC subunit UvrC [Ignavibacteriaceae bacterium]HQI39955.1 excinuclease ABC subunit UvrC [Ignavibacteriaceae bacterium]